MSGENKAVFLSYASQDADAAKRICDALRQAGVEVWFDQSELVGGDAWDQKIRRQIGSCALLIPIISANTQARREGYFRLEWRLAVERMRQMDDDLPFLLPVVIDGTKDAEAFVPERFREVQWTRLPGGETPPAFCARVKKLLGGGMEPGRPRPGGRGEGAASPRKNGPSKWWWALPMFGVMMALFLVMKEGRKDPATPTAPIAPVSEVRQLTEKAQALVNKPGAARAELEAAEELCRKAAKLDPTDGDVLSTWSQVCTWLVFHGFDVSSERKEAARSKAAQALQLAPGSYEARFAQACYLVRGGGVAAIVSEGDQADELLHALLREKPDEPRALLALGVRQGRLRQIAEARKTLGRLAANPAFAATAWGELGWLEMFAANHPAAEADADRANELQPLWRNLILKTLLAVEWRGDLDLALATEGRLPESVQQEDVGVFTATYLGYLRHEPEQMLRLLDATPRAWIDSGGYIGPKAVWAALAHEQLGAKDRAEAQWRLALKSIERRLEEVPDRNLQLLAAYVLAALDRKADAEKMLGLVRDASVPEPLPWLRRNRYVLTQLRLGHTDAALDFLESDPRLTAAVLRIESPFDSLRTLPRFQALQARLEADPSRSPTARPAAAASASSPAVDQKSVAVLAFANLSDDKGNEYFSDGISEELLNVLAKVPGLKVSARTSSFHFKGKDTPVPEIARQLSVAYVVEGSVRRAGDKVRITAQLIKAADGFHVWSDTFTRDLKDIFAVQDEIAGLIAQQLQVKLGTSKAAREVNPEAHRLVLEGRHFWGLRTENGFNRAEEAFRRAIELDPEFAPAHAGLALVLGTRLAYTAYLGEMIQPGEEQRAEAKRALAIDPAQPEAIAALGQAYFQEGRDAESAEEYRKGLAANPNSALLHHWFSLNLENSGRLDEALAEITRATELDPLSGIALLTRERLLLAAGRYTEALQLQDRVVGLLPDVETSFGMEAMSLLKLGRPQEAAEAARKIATRSSLNRRIMVDAHAVHVLRQTGHEAEAAQHAAAILPRFRPTSYQRGAVLVALGKWEEAVPFLERTPRTVRYLYYWDPTWDAWRDDPRFSQLIKKLGIEAEYRVARETLARMTKK